MEPLLTAFKDEIQASLGSLAVQLESSLRRSVASSQSTQPLSMAPLRQPPPSCAEAAEHLLALRSVLRNPQASIRGDAQGQAIAAFLEARQHTLYVAGTGSGKSVLPLLAARDARRLTILLAPYVALLADLHGRGSRVEGGQWRLWADVIGEGLHRMEPSLVTGVLLISPHDAASSDFRAWVATSAQEGVLKRIVIDEAHVLLTEASFRREVAGLRDLRDLLPLAVPLFLTSATVPAEEEPLLASSLGLLPEDLAVIRGPVRRPNLVFKVGTILPAAAYQAHMV